MTQLLHTHIAWADGPGVSLAFVLILLIGLAYITNWDLTQKANLFAQSLTNEALREFSRLSYKLDYHARSAIGRERRRRLKIRTSRIGHNDADPNCNCEDCH